MTEIILCKVIDKVFEEHPKAVEDAKTMEEAVHYLAGLVLRETKGKVLRIWKIVDRRALV